jgi:hypothetical protein
MHGDLLNIQSALFNFDGIVKSRFKDWIPAPRLRGDRLRGYDICDIYLILIVLLSFLRRRESRKMGKFDFLRDCQF